MTDSIHPKRKSYTPFYRRWCDMRARCTNPNHRAYKWYGARGIVVCDRWQSFDLFSEDMLSSYAKGLQLDRLDNNGPYAPDNCKWVTSKQNCRNRRNNRLVDTPLGLMSLAEAAETFSIAASTIQSRLARGYTVVQMLSTTNFRKTT
tara:strand:+ start:147 stop:587 length:441 start_codon:yes stop_codon:yes gene_type:complete